MATVLPHADGGLIAAQRLRTCASIINPRTSMNSRDDPAFREAAAEDACGATAAIAHDAAMRRCD